ncbi:hypothetical protein D3C86_1694910 [compost metagenome]
MWKPSGSNRARPEKPPQRGKESSKTAKKLSLVYLAHDLPVGQPLFETYNASIKVGKPVCNRVGTQEIADISKNCQIRVDPCEFIGIYRAVPVICILHDMQT